MSLPANGEAQLQRALSALPWAQREVFVLYEVEELDMDDVAAIVGCPPAVAYRRHRAAVRRVVSLSSWQQGPAPALLPERGRLTDGRSPALPELAAAIRGLREQHGSVEQARLIEQRVAGQLQRGAANPPANAHPGGSTGWLTATAVLGALVASFAFHPGPALPLPAAAPHALPLPPPPEPPAPKSLPPTPSAHPSLQPARPPRPRRAPRRAPTLGPAAQRVRPEAELVLLQRSQAQLRRDPVRALELAEQHARDYPHGLFAQEREILAIKALLKEHRHDARLAAYARARRFLAAYPDSAYAVRVHALIDAALGPTTDDSSGEDR